MATEKKWSYYDTDETNGMGLRLDAQIEVNKKLKTENMELILALRKAVNNAHYPLVAAYQGWLTDATKLLNNTRNE